MEFLADSDMLVFVGVLFAVSLVYVPAFVIFLRNLTRLRQLVGFGGVVMRIMEELAGDVGWEDRAIERIETFYLHSELVSQFPSILQLIERLHYLVYSAHGLNIIFRIMFRKRECRDALHSVRLALKATEQPYSSLSGEPRRLLESVAANCDSSNQGGKVALKQLAEYIKINERRLAKQRSREFVFGTASVVGVVLAIIALVSNW